MENAAGGSSRWPPLTLRLQLAALLGTLAPQVRFGADAQPPRSGPRGAMGHRAGGRGASPSRELGWPPVGPWRVETSQLWGVASRPRKPPAREMCQRGKAQGATPAWGGGLALLQHRLGPPLPQQMPQFKGPWEMHPHAQFHRQTRRLATCPLTHDPTTPRQG